MEKTGAESSPRAGQCREQNFLQCKRAAFWIAKESSHSAAKSALDSNTSRWSVTAGKASHRLARSSFSRSRDRRGACDRISNVPYKPAP